VKLVDSLADAAAQAKQAGRKFSIAPALAVVLGADNMKRIEGASTPKTRKDLMDQMPGKKKDLTMVDPNPRGLLEPGNLPLAGRPKVENEDGSHSTEYSTSFEDDKGREVLVPTIVNGKFLTPDGKKPPEGSAAEKAMFKRAWDHYLRTGENLGKFSNSDDADAYADKLHNR
jgi:hypothetical protein